MSTYDIERQIALLEHELEELEREEDEAGARAVQRELRDLEAELDEARRWEAEGRGRGWL